MTTTHFDTAGPARQREKALPRRVLVSLPAADAPQGVIAAGRVIARALGAPLHAVLVWPTPIAPCQVARLLRIDPEALEGMVLHVDVGDPARQLDVLTRAEPVAFLVIGAESHGCDLCGLGAIAARSLAAAGPGAIVVRQGASLERLRHILVPLDGTPSTAAALGPAAELAEQAGAELDVVMIEDAAAPPSDEPGAMTTPRYVDQPHHEWRAFSEELVQRCLGGFARCAPGVPTRVFLAAGRPAEEILRFASKLDADLIAMVWHGGRVGQPGAVFREVLEGAVRPVLVLRR